MNESIKNRAAGHVESRKRARGLKAIILGQIKLTGGATAKAIAERTGIKINSVVGRLSELREMCMIKEIGSIKDPDSHVPNTQYGYVEPEERRAIARAKYVELEEMRNGLVNDYIKGNLSQVTKGMIESELRRINEKIEKVKAV